MAKRMAMSSSGILVVAPDIPRGISFKDLIRESFTVRRIAERIPLSTSLMVPPELAICQVAIAAS